MSKSFFFGNQVVGVWFSFALGLWPILVWLGWWCSVEFESKAFHFVLAWLVARVLLPFSGISKFSVDMRMGKSPRARKLKSPPIRCIQLPCSSFCACGFSSALCFATFGWRASLSSKMWIEVRDRQPLSRSSVMVMTRPGVISKISSRKDCR